MKRHCVKDGIALCGIIVDDIQELRGERVTCRECLRQLAKIRRKPENERTDTYIFGRKISDGRYSIEAKVSLQAKKEKRSIRNDAEN